MVFERLIELKPCWMCTSGQFDVHLFHGHLTIADMNLIEATGAGWRRKHPEPTVELVVILPSDARMSHAERARVGDIIRKYEKDRIASATVILADGLKGAVQRSILTGLMLLAPPASSAEGVRRHSGGGGLLVPVPPHSAELARDSDRYEGRGGEAVRGVRGLEVRARETALQRAFAFAAKTRQ